MAIEELERMAEQAKRSQDAGLRVPVIPGREMTLFPGMVTPVLIGRELSRLALEAAEVAMTVALISALTGRPVRRSVAMTGEIKLRGRVLPVGGVKEKVLAAHRACVSRVILLAENERDLSRIPQKVREKLRFVPVERVSAAFGVALKRRRGHNVRRTAVESVPGGA